ncbi:hypothetical protein GCM10010365_32160 [Streptomyces poonensis]|uniref:Uncharacterized protein n=1 Tax=Streptomyces poonensis TaxID=68255 RepID=A0A918PHM8_9ACTN|nr:hypothetical protein GCM10010365_32160 [Streptomyces poonensis]GLJ91379.1 hypothetical protein GCM10017589_39860 [Streptomyces poonensis]
MPDKRDVGAKIFKVCVKVAAYGRGADRPSHDVPFSDARRLLAVYAARAPAGLERGGDWSAGPAGGRAARGERQRAALNQ